LPDVSVGVSRTQEIEAKIRLGEDKLSRFLRQLVCHAFEDRNFTDVARGEEIAAAIIGVANSGMEGDGIVAVLSVSKLYRIWTKSEITPEELCYRWNGAGKGW
jgi:hypothetical protein